MTSCLVLRRHDLSKTSWRRLKDVSVGWELWYWNWNYKHFLLALPIPCQWKILHITFDGESLLNFLQYGSDEFNDKINNEIRNTSLHYIKQGRRHRDGRGGEAWLLTFCVAKIKKGEKRKKRKSFKEETIKRLSPRSTCYCFGNVYCFILDRLEFR